MSGYKRYESGKAKIKRNRKGPWMLLLVLLSRKKKVIFKKPKLSHLVMLEIKNCSILLISFLV
jgi:hypothetical protein